MNYCACKCTAPNPSEPLECSCFSKLRDAMADRIRGRSLVLASLNVASLCIEDSLVARSVACLRSRRLQPGSQVPASHSGISLQKDWEVYSRAACHCGVYHPFLIRRSDQIRAMHLTGTLSKWLSKHIDYPLLWSVEVTCITPSWHIFHSLSPHHFDYTCSYSFQKDSLVYHGCAERRIAGSSMQIILSWKYGAFVVEVSSCKEGGPSCQDALWSKKGRTLTVRMRSDPLYLHTAAPFILSDGWDRSTNGLKISRREWLRAIDSTESH